MAPAYDLTFAYNPHGESTNQHLMSVNNKFSDITIKDVMKLAEQYEIGNAIKIIQRTQAAIQQWPIFANQAGVSQPIINKIQSLHCNLI